jgi:hypothetical protein
MAKAKMICPFSGKACKDCPIYRGRHYFLCFNPKYRGHLRESDEASGGENTSISAPERGERLFKIKSVSRTKSIDPFIGSMPDIS